MASKCPINGYISDDEDAFRLAINLSKNCDQPPEDDYSKQYKERSIRF